MIYAFEYIDPITSIVTPVYLNECPSFPYSHKMIDLPIKSNFQDGYTMVRPRFSRIRHRYNLSWLYLIEDDKVRIQTMELALLGVEKFSWFYEYPEYVDGSEDTSVFNKVNVVASSPVNFELVMKTTEGSYWNITMSIEGV